MKMEKLEIYSKVRSVPEEAQKKIKGGRLSGMTDINPMWRIKKLTELFGACGFGWKYEIIEKRLEEGANDEIAAFVDINLYVKMNDEWSEPIQGTGGSTFVAKEKNGMHTSDECFKMALTDAISIACKALGFGADIYWGKDTTKYSIDERDDGKSNIKKKIDKQTIAAISSFAKKDKHCAKIVKRVLKEETSAEKWDGIYKIDYKTGQELLAELKADVK